MELELHQFYAGGSALVSVKLCWRDWCKRHQTNWPLLVSTTLPLALKQRENANLYVTKAGSLEFTFAKQENGSFVILSTPKKQSEDWEGKKDKVHSWDHSIL